MVKNEDFPVWDFPEHYVPRLRSALAEVNPALGEAIREYEASLVAGEGEEDEESQ